MSNINAIEELKESYRMLYSKTSETARSPKEVELLSTVRLAMMQETIIALSTKNGQLDDALLEELTNLFKDWDTEMNQEKLKEFQRQG